MPAATANPGLAVDNSGWLGKEHTVATAGYNRWLVPPAALAIHLCIGMAYGFSVFWKPLQGVLLGGNGKALAECSAGASTFGAKTLGTVSALFATSCNWSQFDLGWMFTLFFIFLGCSAAIWGGWLERVGPRRAGVVAALCWSGGLVISALGVYTHQLWLMWLGSGAIGGIGLGLGYISPVSTLIKWFPDRRGMATGMAIMGFGGGALVGSPLATQLMAIFKSASGPGVWQTFLVMAAVYLVFMMIGALSYRIPPAGWRPDGWTPPPETGSSLITQHNVHLDNAHRTPQFWLIWAVLCLNVSAGIGIIGAASPMLQETFGGQLFGHPETGFGQFTVDNKTQAAAIGAIFVGLFSLFNIGGRFFWASLSDHIGRKSTYFVFFVLGFICYALTPTLAASSSLGLFVAAFCIIASMYGGGFATIPAYLADMFGTQFVGAIHGRLLTAWSVAGILGPVIVNYTHDTTVASYQDAVKAKALSSVPYDHVYSNIMYILAGLLVLGFIANLLIRPVNSKWYMSDAEVESARAISAQSRTATAAGTFGIDRGGLDASSALAWAVMLIPIAWGVWLVALKLPALYH